MLISLFLIFTGLALIGLYFFVFHVPRDTVAITKWNPQGYKEGWNIGFLPSGTKYLSLKKYELTVPGPTGSNGLISLRAPDGGVVGVRMIIVWSHDYENAAAYSNALTQEETNSLLSGKVQAALNYWINGKPFPATARRALTSLADAERVIRERLTGVNPDMLVNRNEEYLGNDYLSTVKDLAIRIHEINITKMDLLQYGTDKPDWGDGDHIAFDAQAIFKQFHAQTDSLSGLRNLKEALIARYPEEMQEDIEDIYDQVRMSMKENRDRY